ncbi:MAG: diaminopimelate epimerase, partial [Planctomycetota bacterium]
TESGMCGNGLRIAAKFAYEAGHVRERHFPIEVGLPGARRRVAAWVQLHERTVRRVTIELDPPRFERAAIPMLGAPEASALDVELDLATLAGQCPVRICGVGMGNPHAVLFVDELPTDATLQRLGPAIEHHPLFPERTNVSWARCHPRTATIDMRVWERGTGETRACGSGACAVAAAAIRTGRVAGERVRVRPPGGELVVHWPGGEAPVRLTGPACEVFRGLWSG